MSWITAAVRSVVGGRSTKAASLLSATLRYDDTLGCLNWSCALEKNMSSTAVGEVMESIYAKAQKRFSDAGDQGREVLGGGLQSERASFIVLISSRYMLIVLISSRYMLSPCFMRWSLLEWMLMSCRRHIQ